MNNVRAFGISMAAVGLLTAASWADVNPQFTPIHLVRDSNSILLLEFRSVDGNTGLAVAKVQKVLKADPNWTVLKEVRFDLLAMGEPLSVMGKHIMQLISDGEKQALMFVGASDVKAWDEGEAKKPEPFCFLHIQRKWVVLSEGKGGVWDMEKTWEYLNMTWDGGTDMLLRCIEYILSDPHADVPHEEGVEWDAKGITRFGKVPGEVHVAMGVDLDGTGKADLFLACEAGDRLYRWNGKVLADVTAKTGLASRSVLAAWGDFDGDGGFDLASWDGKALRIVLQKADGTFAAPKDAGVGEALKDGCLSLTTLDAGTAAKAGLLAGTKTWPVLLVPKDGGFAPRPLGTGEFPGKELKDPGPCLAADLDGDGLIDVLQTFSGGALFYKGTAPGAFAAGVKTQAGGGSEKFGACLGDFDGDGLPDVLIVGDTWHRLYQNLGGGKFVDTMGYSGALEYIAKPGATVAQSGDINNDGRQDVLIGYGVRMAPQLFFNRGFRSFEWCWQGLCLEEHKSALERFDPALVPQAASGQQAVCLGDFNGDGALDMVLVLTGRSDMAKQGHEEVGKPIAAGATIYWDANNRVVTDVKREGRMALGKAEAAADANDEGVSVLVEGGNLVFFPRAVTKQNGAGVVVSLPLSAPTPGPVNVLAYSGKRLLGAWSVRAGEPGAIIGTRLPCTMTLKWTWPGGKSREKQVQVKDGPVRVLLDDN